MSKKIFDYLVIGGGSGGIASARRAAMYNKKVAVFENQKLGGTCVNVGCVPKKLMYQACNIKEDIETMGKFKSSWFKKNNDKLNITDIDVNFSHFKADRDAYIRKLNGIYQRNLDNSKVENITGVAKFLDNHTLECEGTTYQADHILIATGSTPNILDIPGKEHAITSDGFFELEEIPKRTIVVGGGYIATELAQILSIFGSKVSILVRKCLLSTFDQELAQYQLLNFEHLGINFQCGQLEKIEKNSDGTIKATHQNGTVEEVDCVLFAVGRHPNIASLDLDNTDIQLSPQKAIKVDEYQNTSVDGVYSVGDVDGNIALTPVAIRSGRTVAERVFNNRPDLKVDYTNIPSVIFSHPPIGSIGLSEEKATEKYGKDNISIYKTEFGNMFDSFVQEDELKQKTFMKMICNKQDDERVIGFHAIGHGVDEMMQGVGVAFKAGATKRHFDTTIAIHPTASEEMVLLDPKLY